MSFHWVLATSSWVSLCGLWSRSLRCIVGRRCGRCSSCLKARLQNWTWRYYSPDYIYKDLYNIKINRLLNGLDLWTARKPSSLSDCTNDDDDDEDDDDGSKGSSCSSSVDNEQKLSLMQSFRVAVGYFDRSQLPPAATSCAVKARPKSGQPAMSTKLVRRSEMVCRGASTKDQPTVEDPSAKFVNPKYTLQTNGVRWSLAATVLRCTEPDVLGGCVNGSNIRGIPSYRAVIVPMLASANTTAASASDVSDEPEDLSIRTGACHVSSTNPTTATDNRFQPSQLPGKVDEHCLAIICRNYKPDRVKVNRC